MKQKVVWMSWINWFGHPVVNVRHRDGLSRSFSTCWTLLNTMWITFDPNWQQGKPHRRQLFFARVGYTTTPWSRVCTFQDSEIFGGYKSSAYTKMHTSIRNHHCSDWHVFITGWCDSNAETSTMPHVPEKERAEDEFNHCKRLSLKLLVSAMYFKGYCIAAICRPNIYFFLNQRNSSLKK